MKQTCPHCASTKLTSVAKSDNGGTHLCIDCNAIVLPVLVKDARSKNYQERNAGKFRTLSSSKGLNKFSAKGKRKLQAYAASESAQTKHPEACARCGCVNNLTKHHPYGRSGQTEEGQACITVWVWLCTAHGNRCHDWVHEHPNQAMQEGWLQPEYRQQQLIGERKKPWLTTT